MHVKKLIGKKYNHITIIGLDKYQSSVLIVKCQCECGMIFGAILENVERKKIKSCGCLKNANSELFIRLFEKKIWSLIDKQEDCWIWKGSYRKDKFKSPYITFSGKQFNPTRWFSAKTGTPIRKNMCLIRQCDTSLCINPKHHIMVGFSNITKAIKKEIKCEYLTNKYL